ncbi:hypothetical protein CPB84DRAFT_1753802 [Gymnopilus junonius]|uniref:Uncharacterized protein n=1 Tax=Gymnopilus junonius TaxID=109634 RepID=A0A9P5NAH6_GYMJU|nr:hypothetical protein CPB84DRAFT_1753802 [Gymnopilus junonius]
MAEDDPIKLPQIEDKIFEIFALWEIERNQYRFTPAELIDICYRYHTKKFASKAFDRLFLEGFSNITLEDVKLLGLEFILILAKIDRHAMKIGGLCGGMRWARVCLTEEPIGLGTAVSRFEGAEFGNMGTECREEIFMKLMLGNGFFRGDVILTHAKNKLLEFIPEIDSDDKVSEDSRRTGQAILLNEQEGKTRGK